MHTTHDQFRHPEPAEDFEQLTLFDVRPFTTGVK